MKKDEEEKALTDVEKLMKPLGKDDIEFRIGSTSQGKGFSLLAYKTARTDVKRLNDVFGLNWSNEYFYDSKGLLCSKISVLSNGEWISRIDVGTESFTEKEKGSYSDAFKRAGFKFGIGIELYDFPFIWVNWKDWKDYNGKKTPNFNTSNLLLEEYFCENGVVKRILLTYKGETVYTYGIKAPPKSKITLSENKVLELEQLISQTNSDREKLLQFFGIKKLDEVDFNKCKSMLEKKVK